MDTLSDSDIESSEEDDWTSNDGESANEEEAQEADNNNVANTVAASSAEEANQLPQQSPDISDEEATSKKRKRGRPSLNQSNKVNNTNAPTSTSTSSSSKDKNAETQIDTWDELTSNCDTRKHDFTFAPKENPGVLCNLNGDSTPLDCFFELFDAEVQDLMINFINSFAQNRLETKLPPVNLDFKIGTLCQGMNC